MADITARLPTPLSARIASTSSQITAKAGRAIDYSIAGIPFLSAASPDHPFVIQTAEMNKNQTDQEQEPGEQSLQGWWLRSQDSWHQGAGIDFQESRANNNPSLRFQSSAGVDVWTEGEMKLLRTMVESTATSSEASCLYATSDALYLGVASAVRSTTVGSATTTTSLGTAPGETFTDLAVGKESWYGITAEGSVYTDLIAGGADKSFPLTNADTDFYADPRLAWAKHRLWATYGRRVYVVDTTDVDTTAQDPIYSHPTTDWTYTDIAEGPACIYLAGWSEAESSIQKLILQDDGSIPAISAGTTTAILPRGERVHRISVLAGTWIGIATNRGFRVGAVDVNGDIQYGPLFLRPENCVEAKAITAHDRFFYVSWQTSDSVACVYRVDVSAQPEEDGSFAWARDVETTDAGYFSDLAVVEDGRVVAAFSAGSYPVGVAAPYWYQHATELVLEGHVRFAKIRFRTTERKIFKYIAVDIEPLAGSITIDCVLPNESLNRVIIFNTQGKGEFEQTTLPSDLGPQRSLGFLFTFNRSGTDTTAGPILHSYAVKAVSAVKPQRLIQLPLSCFDKEAWVTGQLDGSDGWARDRLFALHALEDGADLVLWQDFTSAEGTTGRQVKIDSVRYTQVAPAHATQTDRNYGGIVELLLRTMD